MTHISRRLGRRERIPAKSECMMQPGILRWGGDRRAQHAFSLSVAAELPIEIGEVDRGRRELRTEPQRGLELGLGIRREATPRVEVSKRAARLRPIRVAFRPTSPARLCGAAAALFAGEVSRQADRRHHHPTVRLALSNAVTAARALAIRSSVNLSGGISRRSLRCSPASANSSTFWACRCQTCESE
jgi:hypothetical protein